MRSIRLAPTRSSARSSTTAWPFASERYTRSTEAGQRRSISTTSLSASAAVRAASSSARRSLAAAVVARSSDSRRGRGVVRIAHRRRQVTHGPWAREREQERRPIRAREHGEPERLAPLDERRPRRALEAMQPVVIDDEPPPSRLPPATQQSARGRRHRDERPGDAGADPVQPRPRPHCRRDRDENEDRRDYPSSHPRSPRRPPAQGQTQCLGGGGRAAHRPLSSIAPEPWGAVVERSRSVARRRPSRDGVNELVRKGDVASRAARAKKRPLRVTRGRQYRRRVSHLGPASPTFHCVTTLSRNMVAP